MLKFSAIEIYNEVVKDLLNPENTPLRLLDDPEVRGGILVLFLTGNPIGILDQLFFILRCVHYYLTERNYC